MRSWRFSGISRHMRVTTCNDGHIAAELTAHERKIKGDKKTKTKMAWTYAWKWNRPPIRILRTMRRPAKDWKANREQGRNEANRDCGLVTVKGNRRRELLGIAIAFTAWNRPAVPFVSQSAYSRLQRRKGTWKHYQCRQWKETAGNEYRISIWKSSADDEGNPIKVFPSYSNNDCRSAWQAEGFTWQGEMELTARHQQVQNIFLSWNDEGKTES